MTPIRPPDDNVYAAPALRAEITTILVRPGEERVLATHVWPASTQKPVREMQWPPNASFEYRGYHFHIPERATRAVHETDADAELMRTDFLDAAAKTVASVRIERDEHGRIERIVQTVDGNPSAAEVRFAYDEVHRRISTIVLLYDIIVSSKVTTLDARGLAVSDEETALDGTTRRVFYTYAFNEHGDWIERVASTSSEAKTITRREITYRNG